jgi:hypothetical protein
MWEGGTTGSVPVLGSSIYSTTPTVTFSLTNSSPTALINFRSDNDSSLTSFLTTGVGDVSNGDTLLYVTGTSHGTDNINNDLFEFQGTTTLTDGTYTFSHDDGMLLYLGSSLVVNAPGPTSATTTSFTVCASGCNAVAGSYGFTLLYAEVDGAPAQLATTLPLVSVPEPSTFFMLGTGLLGAAGAVRRRLSR